MAMIQNNMQAPAQGQGSTYQAANPYAGAAYAGSQTSYAPTGSPFMPPAMNYQNAQGGGGYTRPPVAGGSAGAGGAGGGNGYDISEFQPFIDQSYNQWSRLNGPAMESAQRRFDQQMVSRGLTPGTAAYDNAAQNFSRAQAEQQASGAYGALQSGLAAQNQFMGQQLQREGFDTQRDVANISAAAQRAAAAQAAAASRYGADMRNQLGMAQLGENGRQFDNNLDFQYSGLNENARQFDGNLGLNYSQLDSQNMGMMGNLLLGFGNQNINAFNAQNNANGNWYNQGMGQYSMLPGMNFNAGSSTVNPALQSGMAQAQGQGALWGALGQIGGGLAMRSSRGFKDKTGEATGLLDKLKSLPVDRWKYKGEDQDHIGTYAEDFNRAFDLGEKDHINVVDAIGVLTGAVQELAERVA